LQGANSNGKPENSNESHILVENRDFCLPHLYQTL